MRLRLVWKPDTSTARIIALHLRHNASIVSADGDTQEIVVIDDKAIEDYKSSGLCRSVEVVLCEGNVRQQLER